MADYCKKYMKVAWAVNAPRSAVFTRLRCKMWSCEYCAGKNASIWRAFLKERLPEVSGEWWLLTLTAHPSLRTAQQSLANIRENIDKLMKRVDNVFGKIEYVRTYERHPTSDAIHAHFIVSGLAPYVANGFSVKHRPMSIGVITRRARDGYWSVRTWFKKTCQALKMGYIVDVQLIGGDATRAMWYVTKYLTKSQQDIHEPYLRHVQTTKGIGSPENEKQAGWTLGAYITSRTFEAGTRVLDLNTGEIIDNNHWEHTGFYPTD